MCRFLSGLLDDNVNMISVRVAPSECNPTLQNWSGSKPNLVLVEEDSTEVDRFFT